ncbi:MAG: DUF484 family protein [Steroidobacteraceae bacterium]|jgi:hypothetical protein|nr:DUF484 family protein [Steroidobacteraceae bacterium]
MTKPATQGAGIAALNDATVAEYLEAVPDFFEKHPQLVQRLRLADTRGSGTVSLIERQVELLRDRNRKLEQRLVEFVENGRANDELAEKIHRLCVRLVHARGLAKVADALEASLREDFDVQRSVLVLFRKDESLAAADSAFVRIAERDSAPVRGFEALFTSGKPRCGQVRDSQREWLFGDGAVAVASVALVPIGPGGSHGLMALGASDVHRFNPTMSTDFLARIGELIAAALSAG